MSARVVVTGGSGGIGGAIVARFLADGAFVANIDLRGNDRLLPAQTILADLGDGDAIRRAFVALDRLFEGAAPDVLVGCAAISRAAPVLDVTEADLDRVLAVNVRGTFLVAQEAARRMCRAGRGSIVLITSVAAEQAWAQESVYCMSKAANRALVQALAVELAPYGVRVNGVGPGPIDHQAASMAATRADPAVFRHEMERTPLGRFGRPDEVAEAVAMLSRLGWASGQTLYLDGGFLATGLGDLAAAGRRL